MKTKAVCTAETTVPAAPGPEGGGKDGIPPCLRKDIEIGNQDDNGQINGR